MPKNNMAAAAGFGTDPRPRSKRGFPVEVAIFEPHRIKHREAGFNPRAHSDAIYSFTLAPDTKNEGIFCDSPGSRPESISWGLTLDPVLTDGTPGFSASALYAETTGPELLHLIACLQSLYDVNYGADGRLREDSK